MIPFDAAKLERLMAEAGLDAVLATSRHNARYLTGGYYHHFTARTGRSGQAQYLSVVGVPRDLRAAFHVGGGDEGTLLQRFGPVWIDERLAAVRGQPMTVGAALAAADALRRRGLDAGTIGLEMPFLPADAFETLRQELPGATLVDASALLGRLRAIKRPEELELLRRVHRITGEAIAAAMTGATAGRSTQELAASVACGIGARGASFLYCLASVGPGMMRAPGPERWEAGHPLHLDAGGELEEYVSDICRMGSLGPVPAEARAMYVACIEASDRLREQLVPGLPCSEVVRRGTDGIRATRWGPHGGFTAHGMGMVSHESPALGASAPGVLEAGMVLSLETEVRRPDIGHVKFEDSVVIGADGCQSLGEAGREWCAVEAVASGTGRQAP